MTYQTPTHDERAEPHQEHITRAIARLSTLGVQVKLQPEGHYMLYMLHTTSADVGIEIGYLIAQLAHPQYVLGAVAFSNTPDEPFIPLDQRVADYRESYPAYVKYGIYPANRG